MANLLDELSVRRSARPPLAGRGPPDARRASAKSARRRARELALQGLYEWLLGGADAGVVDAHVREQDGFDKCDVAYFDLLLHGVIREAGGDRRGARRRTSIARPSCSRRSSTRRS